MRSSFLPSVAALAALPATFAAPADCTPHASTCASLTAEDTRSMGNNTLFTRWGSATSKDLIHWEDHGGWENNEALILSPSGNGTYNGLGIFSGTAQPVNIHGEVDGTLLIFYTSVSKLPTNWALPYQPGTETQSLALSTDGGKTWEEYPGNPVITTTTEQAPMDWNITGFRDPFLEPSPELDALRGVDEPHYYAVFGSGIKPEIGPRVPLWSAPANNLTDWTFLGALWEPAANTSVGPVLSTGSYGYNFEVSGFFPLYDSEGTAHWYVNVGSEGGNVSFHQSAQWALWNEGKVSRRDNGSVEFTPISGGAADWGSGYALTSFNDTKHNRRVQYAWVREDYVGDAGLFSTSQQGFQGALSLPRELFVHEVHHVDSNEEISYAKNSILDRTEDGSFTAHTMGVRPLPDVVEGLRRTAAKNTWNETTTYNSTTIVQGVGSAHMEINAWISSASGPVGLVIEASPDGEEYTNIIYEPSNHTILVERLHSSNIVEFNNATITGYFYPYSVNGTMEAINMNVFIDGSIAEIYINERFALSARIYPSKECSTGFGVYVGEGHTAEVSSLEAWFGTDNVWPHRPLNSSSQLVFDTPEQTNNYTWWTGN